MTRRPGMSLAEVLVALFILAIGLIAILTMFPLGAAQMGQAVRDDRSAQTSSAADGYLRSYWKSEIVEKGGAGESFFAALDDPDGPGAEFMPADIDDASYPVLIDPMGFVARPTPENKNWVGDPLPGPARATNLPRRTLASIGGNAPLAQRVCSLMDGLGYDDNGRPTQDRELRYNWMAVVQRSSNRNKFASNLAIVVFDNRPHLYAPPGVESVLTVPNFTPGLTSATIPGSPDIKAGNWLLDATVGTGPSKIRHANFYRVVSATPNGTDTVLELQTPIKPRSDGSLAPFPATVVVLRGVSGVFFRPQLTSE